MKVLVFDTETTGLPTNWKAPMTKLDNWPYVIQLAWVVADETGKILKEHEYLIKPDGWTVPTGQFWQENGFKQELSIEHGVDLSVVLDLFVEHLSQCDLLISHNMQFDYNVLGAEMIRHKKQGKVLPKICTKLASTDYCKIPNKYNTFKWPKLIELHEKLFNKGFTGAHDALVDVIACKNCFFELLKLGVIKEYYTSKPEGSAITYLLEQAEIGTI